jgi:hypothetical protein
VRQYRARKVIYDVEMYSAADSQAIRDAYGMFFRKKSGQRLPDGLRSLSISNVTTFPTRVRVRLLKEVCHRHQAANPTLSCYVTNYLARPELKIRDRKGPLLSYSYTKTVEKLSHHLTLGFLKDLYTFARTNLPDDEVAERFLILTSDLMCTSTQDLLSMSIDEGGAPANEVVALAAPPPGQVPAPLSEGLPPSLAPLSSTPSATSAPQLHQAVPTPDVLASPGLEVNPSTLQTPFSTAHTPPSTLPSDPTNNVLTDPGTSTSNQFATPSGSGPVSNRQDLDNGFELVPKRNRDRFTRRATPYPGQR